MPHSRGWNLRPSGWGGFTNSKTQYCTCLSLGTVVRYAAVFGKAPAKPKVSRPQLVGAGKVPISSLSPAPLDTVRYVMYAEMTGQKPDQIVVFSTTFQHIANFPRAQAIMRLSPLFTRAANLVTSSLQHPTDFSRLPTISSG